MSDANTPSAGLAVGVADADSIEDAVLQILERRRKCNASGQRGEDIDLIRASLVRQGASLRSTAAEVA